MNQEEIAYQEALDYLYSFIDYSLTRALRNLPEKFDLDRMRVLAARLGNPQERFSIIHVAGTKGKGSVCAMLSNALHASGNRVGLYSSPHLRDYTERIQVNGNPIPKSEMVRLVDLIKPVVSEIPQLTTFELTTMLGFLYFAEQNVNVAVVEVGLGGRLDATNIVTPAVSVITSLSYDHMAVLGNTLSEIAYEKAGIIKSGRPIILSPQKEEAHQVIQRISTERNSPLTIVGKDYLFAAGPHSLTGQTLFVWPSDEQELVNEFIESGGRQIWEPVRLSIPLLGHHQVENGATAYAALQIAREQGIRVTEKGIREGFASVFWPGRFELLRRNPPVIIDSAHNRDSALKLRLTLDDYLPGVPVILVFGASEDKDIAGMFMELMPRVHSVVATQSVHPRALEPGRLVEMAHQHGKPARAIVPLEEALAYALEMAGQEMAILITGSIFVAAAAREVWPEVEQQIQDPGHLSYSPFAR